MLCCSLLGADGWLLSKRSHRFEVAPVQLDQVTSGMAKAQVERIIGPPTTIETKEMLIFKKTYRYEDGAKFALFTFKNDVLDSKDGNLSAP